MAAARRFLAGYLPYSYGQAPRAGSRRPRRRWPARCAARRRGFPRRIAGCARGSSSLEVASSNGDLGLDLTAVVDDGRRRYSMILAVRPAGERWLVVALS